MEHKIIFKNTPHQTQDLINKLAHDDLFRQRFEKNPKETLVEYDIILPDNLNSETKLPSKQEMQKMQQELINKQPPSSVVVTPNAHYFALFAFFVFVSVDTPSPTAEY